MPSYSLTHLSDSALERGLESAVRDEAAATAWLLAHLAEFEARRCFAPAGYASMSAYCTRHLRLSEDAAQKRLRVARAARRFPAIFQLIAGGRLHLSGALLLAPHLTTENAAELLVAATDRTRSEIEHLIAARFPQADVPERIAALAIACGAAQEVHGEPAPGRVFFTEPEQVNGAAACSSASRSQLANPEPARDAALDPAAATVPTPHATPAAPATPPVRVKPLAPERYALQCTVSRETYEKLQRVQELLGHDAVAAGLPAVVDRALAALLRELKRRKCAATERPRTPRPSGSKDSRHIPAEVKRTVWKRDQGRCTFVAENGVRCGARTNLELDHEVPFARGGTSTAGNLRLRCRTHNRLEADRAYGTGFMENKRRGIGQRKQAKVERAGHAVARGAPEAPSGTSARPALQPLPHAP